MKTPAWLALTACAGLFVAWSTRKGAPAFEGGTVLRRAKAAPGDV
jgi:hypothetical protein